VFQQSIKLEGSDCRILIAAIAAACVEANESFVFFFVRSDVFANSN
jgi:hypothetical protein